MTNIETNSLPFGLAVVALAWLLPYLIRRYVPKIWLPLTRWPDPEHPVSHAIQALPSALVGALAGGVASGDVVGALYGAAAALVAPLWHHVLKASPAAYQGPLRDAGVMAVKRAKAYDKARKAGLGLLVLLAVGCVEPRSPGRDACYLAADHQAAQAYLDECAGYPDTRVCPTGDAIEERHGKALEACP